MIKEHPTLPIICDSETGMICRNGSDKWTSGSHHPTGYMTCTIEKKSYRVHRLIADTFLELDESKPEVDHIDRDKTNNRLDNLRRVSHKENCRNTCSYESVENRGWRHKNCGYSIDRYLSLRDSEEYKERRREASRKWSRLHPEKRRETALNYYHRMVDSGYKYVKCPDGKRHWIKGGSLSSTE